MEKDVKSTGFFRKKAKYLKQLGQMLVEKFESKVPETMDELILLPGVARKTANIVLWNGFGIIGGVAVDTHVQRLAQRLKFTESRNPAKIERDLMGLVPKEKWPKLTDLLIFHGRRICTARKPSCEDCTISSLCPSAFTFKLPHRKEC